MKLKLLYCSIALFTCCESAFAQFGMSGAAQRRMDQRAKERYNKALETGKGLKLMHSVDMTVGATLAHKGIYNFEDGTLSSHPTMPDSVIKQSFDINTKLNFAVSTLTQFDFVKLDRKNALAFVWGLNATINIDKSLTNELRVLNGSYFAKLHQTRVMVAVPLGFSFKTGGFASRDKADRLSFAFGATLAPTFQDLSLVGYGPLYYDRSVVYVQPYYFAEFGVFAGMKWKVRLGVYPQGYKRIHASLDGMGKYNIGANAYRNIDYKSTGPLFQITFGTMRNSNDWENSRW